MSKSNGDEQFVLKDWLASCGFSDHLSAFESNGIGREELLMLKEEDLKELGVERLGERKRMMQQIGALKRNSIAKKTQQTGIALVKSWHLRQSRRLEKVNRSKRCTPKITRPLKGATYSSNSVS